MNVFMVGCTNGWTANAIYLFVKDYGALATPPEYCVIVSMSEFGKLITAIPAALLVHRVGRKLTLTSIGTTHFLCWLQICVNSSVLSTCVARLVT